MTEHTVVRGNREHTVRLFNGQAIYFWRHVNPRTGKGWQRTHDSQRFTGGLAHNQAMAHWMQQARA